MPTSTRRATSAVAAAMEYLLPRDRLLLQLLDVHRVLTTSQIATLLGFGSLRRCQDRLHRLHQLGLLERWRHRDGYGSSQPWRWTLGPVDMQMQAAAGGQRPTSQKTIRDRLAALVTSPTLEHRIGVNQFFVDLLAHSRVDPGARLLRWSPARFSRRLGGSAGPSHDGHEYLGMRADRHDAASAGHGPPGRGLDFLSGAVTATYADSVPFRAWYPCWGSCWGRCGATSRNGHRDRPGDPGRSGLGTRVGGRAGVGVEPRLETVIGTDPAIWQAPQRSPDLTGAVRHPERPDGSSPIRACGNA